MGIVPFATMVATALPVNRSVSLLYCTRQLYKENAFYEYSCTPLYTVFIINTKEEETHNVIKRIMAQPAD